jgi:capsular polysaccharide biosynthesis protein
MNDRAEALRVSEPPHNAQVWVPSQSVGRTLSAEQQLRSVFSALAFLVRQRFAFITTLATGCVCAAVILLVIPKTYQASAHVLIVAANVARDPSVTSVDLPAIATSSVLLSQVEQKLNLPLELAQFKGRVHATVKSHSSIMEIQYRDKVPERAVAVPNAIADALVSYYDSISGSGADVTIRKLDVAIADVQHRLRTIEDAAGRQMQLHPFVQSEKALDGVTSRLDDLTSQRRQAYAALAADVAQRDAISADPAIRNKAVRYEKLQNDPKYRELASNIARDEAELAVDRTTLTEEHPAIRALEKKLAVERAMSGTNVSSTLSSADSFSTTEASSAIELRKADAAIAGDRAKLDAINGLIAGANSRLRDTLSAGVFADRLRLQHDAAKADYLALTARRAAALASRAEALSMGSLVVVDRAVRSDMTLVGLGKAGIAIVMVVLAFAIAVAVAFIVDALDPRLSRADQIERLYHVPLVALIEMDS